MLLGIILLHHDTVACVTQNVCRIYPKVPPLLAANLEMQYLCVGHTCLGVSMVQVTIDSLWFALISHNWGVSYT